MLHHSLVSQPDIYVSWVQRTTTTVEHQWRGGSMINCDSLTVQQMLLKNVSKKEDNVLIKQQYCQESQKRCQGTDKMNLPDTSLCLGRGGRLIIVDENSSKTKPCFRQLPVACFKLTGKLVDAHPPTRTIHSLFIFKKGCFADDACAGLQVIKD